MPSAVQLLSSKMVTSSAVSISNWGFRGGNELWIPKQGDSEELCDRKDEESLNHNMMRQKKKKKRLDRKRNTKSKLRNTFRTVVGFCQFAYLHPEQTVITTFKNPRIRKGSLHGWCASSNFCSSAPFHCYCRPWCYSWPLPSMGWIL